MPSMTLSLSKELKDMTDKHPEINWSEVARQSFREKLTDLEFFEEFKSRSELTEEEAIELGKKVNLRIRKLRRSVTRSKKVSLEGMDQSNEICYRF